MIRKQAFLALIRQQCDKMHLTTCTLHVLSEKLPSTICKESGEAPIVLRVLTGISIVQLEEIQLDFLIATSLRHVVALEQLSRG